MNNYDNLLEKVQSRLESWKAKQLTMAGRSFMVQSVSSAIPRYAMQSTILPQGVLRLIKLIGITMNNVDSNHRKLHRISWKRRWADSILHYEQCLHGKVRQNSIR